MQVPVNKPASPPALSRNFGLAAGQIAMALVFIGVIALAAYRIELNREQRIAEEIHVERVMVKQLVGLRQRLQHDLIVGSAATGSKNDGARIVGMNSSSPESWPAGENFAKISQSLAGQGWDSSSSADVTGSIAGATQETSPQAAMPGQAPVMGVVSIKGQAYAAVAARGATPAVALQPLDMTFLDKLSRAAGVAPMRIAEAGATPAHAAQIDISRQLDAGKAGPHLVLQWQPKRPGDLALIRDGLILMGATILIALIMIGYLHNAMKKLRASEAQAQRLAGFDKLTDLPNRSQFGHLLALETGRSRRAQSSCALLYVDIDRFKEINDTCGQEAGDKLIQGTASRIASLLQPGDRLARIDGDEFAILQTEIVSARDCEVLATKIHNSLRQPIDLGNIEIRVRVSIGIAMFPADAASDDELTQAASSALALAKKEGRDRFVFFEKMLGDDMKMRRTREEELRKAIETGNLVVHYQPIMSADGLRLSCVEALVRWPHPLGGLVPPDEFISLAEDRGLILPLGEYVLRQACRDGRRWPGVRVAVNVSPIQFRQKDFAKIVERVLVEESFDPTRLELELTEGVVIADADEAEAIMFDLRGQGIRLALDDFGMGYSSLVYLRRFAFDKIKIDKSFLESMESTGESAIILHSLIHLGRALGLTVTAEGIETPEQHRFLQAAGAHELQGFLFSRPVPREQIDRILAAQRTYDDADASDSSRSVA
ncbi:MAG: bifunctional diguanylate cyclase/phosphodiesterase [Hyphomicrobiales bacterium]|nr:bifunctional diguanylate cyclase/phosphodiesterase [Hyphomicrobiales bacterium]